MEFQVGYATDIGKRRKQNQDSGIALPEQNLFVVADGMGGHQGGEIASAMVTQVLPQAIQRQRATGESSTKKLLEMGILASNDAIFQRSLQEPNLRGMGTTTTAMLFTRGKVTIGHVGDSRAYFFRPGAIWQLTRDHSLVAEKLRAGLLTRSQARADQTKNVITRCVGFEPEILVDTYEFPIQPGDVFLMCSDGLSGLVDDIEILRIVQKEVFEANAHQKAVESLVQAANNSGGDDNVTVLIVQVKSC